MTGCRTLSAAGSLIDLRNFIKETDLTFKSWLDMARAMATAAVVVVTAPSECPIGDTCWIRFVSRAKRRRRER